LDNPFFVKNVFSPDEIEDIRFMATKKWIAAGVYSSKHKGRLEPDTRKTDLMTLDPQWFPDFSHQLLKASDLKDRDLVVREFQYLRYRKGHFFKSHYDRLEEVVGGSYRVCSTITLVDHTDDLQGGELQILQNGKYQTVPLEKGQTLFFDSAKTKHRVTEVLSGVRYSLVAWIHKFV